MRTVMNRLMVLLAGATIALATVGVGYGLWSGTLTITGQVETGSVALAFVDTPGVSGGPYVTPYTDDDNIVNDAGVDPGDTGHCASPLFDDDGDGLVDEDPVDGADNDGDTLIDEDPAGKNTTCDPRSTAVWTTLPLDEDGDGAADEDPADGVDNDADGKVDEDGVGGWVTPFAPTSAGQDVGQTFASVEDAGKTLRIDLFSPSVFGGGVVYSPTAHAKVVNNGTIPVIVVDVHVSVVPPYELWNRDGVGGTTDFAPLGVCNLNLGDECAAPLIAEVIGLTEGVTVLEPGVPVDIMVKVYMTPAADPNIAYALTITITGNQFNEPGA